MLLGTSKKPEAVKEVARAAGHPDVKIRRECVKAFETLGTEEIIEPLMPLLKDQDSGIRTGALRALRKFKKPELFDMLKISAVEEGFRARPFSEKKEFLMSLGILGGSEAMPVLREHFKRKGLFFQKDDKLELRAAAAYGLACVGTDEAIALLEQAVNSRKSLLRDSCRASIKLAQQRRS
jgi:HEAT repeat protein